MKHILTILTILLLLFFACAACTNKTPNNQTTEAFNSSPSTIIKGNNSSTIQPSGSSITVAPNSDKSDLPVFFKDIGKTFNTIKKEHPEALIKYYNILNASAQCLGEPESKYAYYFFGTQDIGFANGVDVNKHGDELKCAGFYSTAGVIFPETKDSMSIVDFFSAIGVTSYEYITEVGPGQGWFQFEYKGMHVNLNTTSDSINASGIFKPITHINSIYPVVISNSTIIEQNQKIVYIITEELNKKN